MDVQETTGLIENQTDENAKPANNADNEDSAVETSISESAEIARLKAELQQANNKNDKLAKENADQRKALNSFKSAEQIMADEKAEADRAKDARLAELEMKFAVAETAKKVMPIVADEKAADAIATAMYGAADPDSIIAAFSKILKDKERNLRAEYGKIPTPGKGSGEVQLPTDEQWGKMGYKARMSFATEHPEAYQEMIRRVNERMK